MILLQQTTDVRVWAEWILEQGTHTGLTLVKASLIFFIGRFLIGLVRKLMRKLMAKKDIDPSVRSFAVSLVNITLTVLLIIAVIGALGVQTTSFAALIASVGVAVGMALSGNLSNFAGGLIILLFRPYRVGDYISAHGVEGTVKEIQIFHTILLMLDNRRIYIPNGQLSSGLVTNYNVETRRVEWVIGVEYGTDINKAKEVLAAVFAADRRIFTDPAPYVRLQKLGDSSLDLVIRVWIKSGDYWEVNYETNQAIYEAFNAAGIAFPFPSVTLYKGKD